MFSVILRLAFSVFDGLLDLVGKQVPLADDLYLDLVFDDLGIVRDLAQGFHGQLHQEIHLGPVPAEVLRRECVYREGLHSELHAPSEHLADLLLACEVSLVGFKTQILGVTPVAVHYDGYVVRDRSLGDLLLQLLLVVLVGLVGDDGRYLHSKSSGTPAALMPMSKQPTAATAPMVPFLPVTFMTLTPFLSATAMASSTV